MSAVEKLKARLGSDVRPVIYSVGPQAFVGELSVCEACGELAGVNMVPVRDTGGRRAWVLPIEPWQVIPTEDGYGCESCSL